MLFLEYSDESSGSLRVSLGNRNSRDLDQFLVVIMIDGNANRNRQFCFELQNSRVFERRMYHMRNELSSLKGNQLRHDTVPPS